MKICTVIKPGLFTTVQDKGRFGYQRFGVPVSGVMDAYAFVAANVLVGNKPNDACLEITLLGPELKFLDEAQIAFTGAALSATINGKAVACWQTLKVCKGEVLSFGYPQMGCRAYLAIRGGLDAPVILGSRSTCVRGRFGGFQGRQLKAGDVIEAYRTNTPLKPSLLMPQEFVPNYSNELTVNVVLGPQADYFTDQGIDVFLSSVYTVTTDSDRMGYRLNGPQVEQRGFSDMVSDAIPVGAIQTPRSGQPIIVMRDTQTTGGYPKIAVAATPDISKLGQVKPNDRIRFSRISLSKAREKSLEFMKSLSQMKNRLEPV